MSAVPLLGINLIKEFEGFYPDAYPDPKTGNLPITIGYGSTKKSDGTNWHLGDTISLEDATELLLSQLEHDYLPPLTKIPGWAELNTNQQGAILSFAYNLGARFYDAYGFASITRMLKEQWWKNENKVNVKEVFVLYRNPGSNVEAGLRRRREAEAKLFLTPV